VHKELFRERCYDIDSLPSRPLAADVGANIGLFSVFVKRCSPDAEIAAFEPVPHTAAVLRQNISLHQLASLTVHEVALGNLPARPAHLARRTGQRDALRERRADRRGPRVQHTRTHCLTPSACTDGIARNTSGFRPSSPSGPDSKPFYQEIE
jgi:FkbM family methyltransferase